MASYKSQYDPTSRPEASSEIPQRLSSSRLPTRKPSQHAQPQPQVQPSRPSRRDSVGNNHDTNATRFPIVRKAPPPIYANIGEPKKGASTFPPTSVPQIGSRVDSSRYMDPKSFGTRFAKYEAASRTPSLVSGSSVSTPESPNSQVLRRRSISIGKAGSTTRTDPMSSPNASGSPVNMHDDLFEDSVLGITLPAVPEAYLPLVADHGSPGALLHPSKMSPFLATHSLPPPTPLYTSSNTPSSRYTESPGPLSVPSLSSTPTSLSSYSPGLVVTSRSMPTVGQASPARSRPPLARQRTENSPDLRDTRGLSCVRESSSSSSASTVIEYSPEQQTKFKETKAFSPERLPPTEEAAFEPANPSIRSVQDKGSSGFMARSRVITPIVPPPELAHLMDPPQMPASSGSVKPARPSREGTPDISSFKQPSPIVYSNMASLPSPSYRRRPSAESRAASTSPVT
ncbi:hypothetical protein LTS18_010194, partial [Coniosporium uncinatum]